MPIIGHAELNRQLLNDQIFGVTVTETDRLFKSSKSDVRLSCIEPIDWLQDWRVQEAIKRIQITQMSGN